MARFRAFDSDSDEDDVSVDEQEPTKYSADEASFVEEVDEDEESLEEETSESEESDADADSQDETSSQTSEMHEDELVVSRPGKPAKDALVQDDDGAYRHAHELSPQPTASALRRDLDLDPQRIQVMQSSLFRLPEESAAMRALDSQQQRQRPDLFLNRKHRRDSDGESMRQDLRGRSSFAHDLSMPAHRPTRKYARVESSASAVKDQESTYVDAGLALGRSFRVGWGPGGILVHSGSLVAPSSTTKTSANSSVIYRTVVPLTASPASPALSAKFLQHHLSHSSIVTDDDGVPYANPQTAELNFLSFASLFSATDPSYEANLFRLGHALFDSLDLKLADSISVDIRNRVSVVARKSAFSTWLEQAAAPSVDADIFRASSDATFLRLTGNQVEQATFAAVDAGNSKLATLVTQAGGEEGFKADLREQLEIWRVQKVEPLIPKEIYKVYSLLAGNVEDDAVLEGLDWKRVFGLHLWFHLEESASIEHAYASFNLQRLPIPWYAESSTPSTSRWRLPPPESITDGLFALIRLHAERTWSLSHALSALSFSPSPVDYSLPWHLYVVLSRCLSVRDFADRLAVRHDQSLMDIEDEDGTRPQEGHSPTADLLTSGYAGQLEQAGLIAEAVFVLLHIEGSRGREKAVRELLVRSAYRLDDWTIRTLRGSLALPGKWVNEALAIRAVQEDNLYSAYELYLQAGLWDEAHRIAVSELAPDALICQDLELLRSLLTVFPGKSVAEWHSRGKALLDYVDVMTRLPLLIAARDEARGGHDHNRGRGAVPDVTEEAQLEELTRSIPRLVGLVPEIFNNRLDERHKVVATDMVNSLVRLVDRVKPSALTQLPPTIDEASRKAHIQSTALASFMKSISLVAGDS